MRTRREIKQDVKSLLKEANPRPWLVTLITWVAYGALAAIGAVLLGLLFVLVIKAFVDRGLVGILLGLIAMAVYVTFTILLNAAMTGGYLRWCVGVLRKESMPASVAVSELKHTRRYLDGFWAVMWRSFLWCLVPIAGPILSWICSLRYCLVLYLMVVDETYTVREALHISREVATSHLFDLIVLGLSFIGNVLLITVTMGIAGLWQIPYIAVTTIAYYGEVCKEYGVDLPGITI